MPVLEGGRHRYLYRKAGALVREPQLTVKDLGRTIAIENLNGCQPPLPKKDVRKVIEWMKKKKEQQ